MSIVLAILALGLIIFVHELGHFLVAKLFGVGVLEFSIGFGPRLLTKVYKNTRYSLKLIPLGGSCAMLGEDEAGSGDFSVSDGEALSEADAAALGIAADAAERAQYLAFDGVYYRRDEIAAHSFNGQKAWKRFFIAIAGVSCNFLLAFLLAMLVISAAGYDRAYLAEASMQENPVFAEAGLREWDEITALGEADGRIYPVHTYRDIAMYMMVHAPEFQEDTVLYLVYERDGIDYGVDFKPLMGQTPGEANRLGLSFYTMRMPVSGFGELLSASAQEVWYNIRAVFESFRLMFKGRVSSTDVMGPVGTVAVIGETVEKSQEYGMLNAVLVLLNLCVLISANLGVMNLLPIPALDGGRLLFILVEMLTGRRLNPELEGWINAAGMILLLLLMFVLLGNDIKNLVTGAYNFM